MQQIRRDTVKTVRHSKLNIDTMTWHQPEVDTSFAQINRESFKHVMAQPRKEKVLTAFDTIQPCDVSLLAEPTYYTAKSQPVRNAQEIDMPMSYDILFNGVVFSFTLWMSAKYLMSCGPAWRALISELREV